MMGHVGPYLTPVAAAVEPLLLAEGWPLLGFSGIGISQPNEANECANDAHDRDESLPIGEQPNCAICSNGTNS